VGDVIIFWRSPFLHEIYWMMKFLASSCSNIYDDHELYWTKTCWLKCLVSIYKIIHNHLRCANCRIMIFKAVICLLHLSVNFADEGSSYIMIGRNKITQQLYVHQMSQGGNNIIDRLCVFFSRWAMLNPRKPKFHGRTRWENIPASPRAHQKE
jgi:hypothetical protein